MKDLVEHLRASIDFLSYHKVEQTEQVIYNLQEVIEILESLSNPDKGTLTEELYELADWAQANIFEVPINLPSILWTAGATIESLTKKEN